MATRVECHFVARYSHDGMSYRVVESAMHTIIRDTRMVARDFMLLTRVSHG